MSHSVHINMYSDTNSRKNSLLNEELHKKSLKKRKISIKEKSRKENIMEYLCFAKIGCQNIKYICITTNFMF